MIIQNSFVILYLINCLQTSIEENFYHNVNKRSTNEFQRYGGKLKVLNTYNNTVYFDNILHKDINNYSMEIEKAFRNIIAMHGVQYIYKRDFYWRTWRYGTKASDIIFFKSQSINPINCRKCHAGFWVVEEKPPLCQYEILALKSDQEICVFTQRNNIKDPCPKIISTIDLIRECGNPIRTKIRITYKYANHDFERNTVICQGRENCEITTLYTIYHGFIVFQIINSRNHVFYSRIMKNGYRNYVYVYKNVKLVTIKNKNNEIKRFDKSKKINTDCFNISNTHDSTKKILLNGLNYKVYNTKTDGKIIQIFHETKTELSPCQKMQLMDNNDEENENYSY